MSNFENGFDKTVWDPVNPEYAVEDPLHGSGALEELLQTPPMRFEDGTYHVFGGYYLCGTNTFDAEGKPFKRFHVGFDPTSMREMRQIIDWVEKYHNGELPPREEMNLPEFQYNVPPYFVLVKDI